MKKAISIIIVALSLFLIGCPSKPVDETPVMEQKPLVVFLVRHAEKVDAGKDPELSKEGKKRTEDLAEILRSANIDHVHSTDYIRTRDTATPLAKANGVEVEKYNPDDLDGFAEDLKKAIAEMYSVLKPHGRLVMSDPTCEQPMNDELRNDERLRALCLSGSLSIADYVKALTDAGFGTIEIRARKPYRILDPKNYPTDELIYIESIEVAAIKDPMPADGPCIFTGRAAIYYGAEYRQITDWNPFDYTAITRSLNVHWLEFAFFAEIGRVAPVWQISTLHSEMKWSAGGGIRIFMNNLILRLDNAFGTEGLYISMFVDHAF